AWSKGYVPVNEGLAAATLEELDREPDAAVLFHDYHLYLAPRLVREARPEVVTSHFLHIPWPEPDYWHALPPELRVAVHEGLLANDVVGFHTERWRRAFLLSAERLLGARVDREAGTVEAAAWAVNERFGNDDWQPVELDVADDFLRSVAGYKQFDVLLVNPVFDGLNLVTKEAFLVNERDGALVLSENAGVHEELGEWAITVNPIDVCGQANALYEALTLEPGERRRRADAIRAQVRTHDIKAWVDAQLADLDAV